MNIRSFTSNDIDFAYQCVLNEGWQSETKKTFQNFYGYNLKGCFIAEVGSQPVGICVATKYQQYGFIEELIVIKEERGKGYGKLLFKHSIQLLLEKLALQTNNQPARIGVLESNIKAAEYFRNHVAVEEQTPCWRMVLGESERLGVHKHLIGVGSPAKG